ncbi:MAG: hypothetical protein GXX85_11055 [Ignavibacteria bacterium]|nr:hypothetical protein [Ignavibacteria bacterium]
MSSTSETGHVTNVKNFASLTSSAAGLEAAFNPTNAEIMKPALEKKLIDARDANKKVADVMITNKTAIGERNLAYKLLTRVLKAMIAAKVSEPLIANAKSFIDKIKGTRAEPKKTEEEKAALKAKGKSDKEISASQKSYENQADNFEKLIKLLASIPIYKPNETDLKVEALKALQADLVAKNEKVKATEIPLNNARIARDEILYAGEKGLVDLALTVKNYYISAFGTDSRQYKQISKLKFTRN